MVPKRLVFLLMTVQLVDAGEGSRASTSTSTDNSTSAEETTDVQPISLVPDTTICGISSYLDQFPWMALLIFEGPDGQRAFCCGGALINKRYVLTTTFCIKGLLRTDYKCVGVRLGEYNTNTDPDCIRSIRGVKCAPSPIDIDVEEQILHERSVFDTESNELAFDIALLRLKKEVEYTETVRPVCLFHTPEERSKTYIGQKLKVAGWGTNATHIAKQSFIKRKIQIPVTDREVCKSRNSKFRKAPFNLTDEQFCAGGEKGKGVCPGDYGSPLMVATADEKAKVHWYALGMVSLAPKYCGEEDVPAVFTNISAHIPWILNKLRP